MAGESRVIKQAKIKNEIVITYKAQLETDLIEFHLGQGKSVDAIMKDIKSWGVKSIYVRDYEVEDVESIGTE